MRIGLALLLSFTAACSQAQSSGTSSQQKADTQEAGSCGYPKNVVVSSNPSGPGCFGSPAKSICEVSNGATVNLEDGGVTGGTETCHSLCGASQYEMTCEDSQDGPDPALGCTVIPIPTPSCCLYYCCPCAK